MQEFNDRARPPPAQGHQKELVNLFNRLSGCRHHWQVFTDFCEMAAISFSNAVDRSQAEKREARYMEIAKNYNADELQSFARGIGHLVEALEEGFSDILGRTYHELELHNKWAGQYFTPYELARAMAALTVKGEPSPEELIKKNGFVKALEPAVGSGAMVIALADVFREAGINYQQHLHVTAVDIDSKCVHMAYAQLSLLHIPAVIVHGNSLSLEEWDRWCTPAHIMGGWTYKLRRREGEERALDIITAPPPLPQPAAPEPGPDQKPDEPPSQLTLF